MFRELTILAFSISAVGTVSAQGTELIIRRSGQADQVIRLDEKQAREMTAKVSEQLKGAMKELKDVELARGQNSIRFTVDTLKMASARRAIEGHLEEMTARTAELGARAATAPRLTSGVTRIVRDAIMQPRIGIFVDNSRSQDSDKIGALVASVSPGGPADKAGLRSGDIITKVDGKSIASTGAKTAAGDEMLPGVRLIEIISKLTVGKSVPLEYRRGNATLTTKVTPVEEDEIAFTELSPTFIMRGDSLRGRVASGTMMLPRTSITPRGTPAMPIERNGTTLFENAVPSMPGGSFTIAFANGGPLSSLELVSLNEKLGNYFGTTEGVLVVNVGPKDAFGLVPGDVIVSVDSRKVTSSSQLMRIFRTYDKGEEFKIQIMRQKKAETLTGKLP